MVPDFVFYCAVSKGQSALPTGGSKRIRALPGGTAGPRGPGELAIAPLGPLASPLPLQRGPVVEF